MYKVLAITFLSLFAKPIIKRNLGKYINFKFSIYNREVDYKGINKE